MNFILMAQDFKLELKTSDSTELIAVISRFVSFTEVLAQNVNFKK